MPGHVRHGFACSRGLTLVELLMAIALIAVMILFSFAPKRSNVAHAVIALRSQIVQARFEAIERNEPIAVVYRPELAQFQTLTLEGLPIELGCERGRLMAHVSLGDYPGVRALEVPTKGIVWLPSGTGRTCTGSGAYNQTIELTDRFRAGRVVISRAGRVRSELDT